MLKFADNPPIVWPSSVLTDKGGPWWVAHTKARFEKAFAWDMHGRQIPYFLPMIERVRVSGGRKRRGLVPLFSSYVFFRGSPVDRQTALATDRLCQVIEVRDQRQFLRELADIQRVLT